MSGNRLARASWFVCACSLVVFGGPCIGAEDVPVLRPLRAGSVKPAGWMREQMRLDLERGLAGAYERIWTSVSLELFVAQKRAPGLVDVRHGSEVSKEQSWWAGEHEGYFKDAMLRLAI